MTKFEQLIHDQKTSISYGGIKDINRDNYSIDVNSVDRNDKQEKQ